MKISFLKEITLTVFLFCCLTFLDIKLININRNNQYLIVFAFSVLLYSFFFLKDFSFNLKQKSSSLFPILLFVLGLHLFFESVSMILYLTMFKYEDMYYVTYENIPFKIFTSILIYPFLEELFFRKIILEKLVELISPKKAIIFSALIFLAFHIYSDTNLIHVFSIGVFLGYLYIKTRSFGLILITHSLSNMIWLIYTINLKSIDLKVELFKTNLWLTFLVVGLFLIYLSYRLLKNNGKIYNI